MTIDPDAPAYPGRDEYGDYYTGITIRQRFVLGAMQGLLANPNLDYFDNYIRMANEAKLRADAQIVELNVEQPDG